jgi:NAD(P)H-hydrate repair Nnr-like enzyme with NAD(P)H-hydrate epimerase domain
MNFATAVLDVRQSEEADRLTLVAGTPATGLIENVGNAVAREIERRWSGRSITK